MSPLPEATTVPVIVGRIVFSQPSGYGGLTLYRKDKRFDNGAPWQGSVSLYAWSDGIVTWTEERS